MFSFFRAGIAKLVWLFKARAGFGPVMTFLFTSSLLNPIVIALFIPVPGLKVTIWYALLVILDLWEILILFVFQTHSGHCGLFQLKRGVV